MGVVCDLPFWRLRSLYDLPQVPVPFEIIVNDGTLSIGCRHVVTIGAVLHRAKARGSLTHGMSVIGSCDSESVTNPV